MQHRRVLGYCRVSSADQATGSSLADQETAIRRYAAAAGIQVVCMYVEAVSAVREKIERREQIRRLLADVRRGDLVVVDKLDRWSRDPEFTYRSVREIQTAGAAFYSVSEACDPSTPEGDSVLGFRILFAKEEHKRIRERMVGTRQRLRARGLYVEGLPPWGYRRQGGKGPEKNVLVIVPDDAERVRRAYAMAIRGFSLAEIAARLGEKIDRVKDALSCRVYLGEVLESKHGTWIRGEHPPIIDVATFAAARAGIDSRNRGRLRRGPTAPPAETASWWLRDLARCALCGGKMGAAYNGRPDDRRYYYRCIE